MHQRLATSFLTESQNMNFAIPSEVIKDMLSRPIMPRDFLVFMSMNARLKLPQRQPSVDSGIPEREGQKKDEEEEVVELGIPSVKTYVNPPYPEIALKAGIEDKLFVMVLVDVDGNVEEVGEIRGARVFHDAIRKAVPKWKFNPALQNDKPVKMWVTLPITFTLK